MEVSQARTEDRQSLTDREAPMNQLYLIGFLVLAAAIAIFAIQNSGEAVVKFIVWQFHSSGGSRDCLRGHLSQVPLVANSNLDR